MTRTCFILDELYPADPGGIARLMHNIIQHAKQKNPGLDLHIVLARQKPADPALLAAFKNIATLHYLHPDTDIARRFGLEHLQATAIFDKHAAPFLRGMRVLGAVLEAERQCGGFDHIEIPDHMGLGTCVLQAKRAGFAFGTAEITCRIHSSLSAIISAEPFSHPRNGWLAPRLEMERYALQHADRVVAHLPTIASFNAAHFGFGPAWMDKVEIAFPPVLWPATQPPTNPAPVNDIIFTSRFQPFKRPELFIKAAITMLDTGTAFTGRFRLISYGFNPEYIDYLRLLIPARHHRRIRIETNLSAQARLAAIAQSIVVQPSKFESLCALAYEVSAKKRPLLLASDCLAFSDDPHWVDGENCLLFVPTPAGLAASMEQALHWQPHTTADSPPDAAYFANKGKKTAKPARAARPGLMVGPIKDADALARVVAHITPLLPLLGGVVAFGPGPLVPENAEIGFHRLGDTAFQGDQWQQIARGLKTKTALLCAPDALPTAKFVQNGGNVVAPGVVYSTNARDTETGNMLVYPGKFDTISIMEPRIAPACILLHRDDLALIDPADDHDILARLITRLARSSHDLRLGPAPLVEAFAYQPSPPSQLHLGYDSGAVWQSGLRWIGTDVKPSQRHDLLAQRPVRLGLSADRQLECSTGHALQIDTGAVRAYALTADLELKNRILTLAVAHAGGEGDITVSLQQAQPSAARAPHNKGDNCRTLKPGQAYRMRWGPIRGKPGLALVVSSPSAAKLRIERPIITSIP